MFCHNHLLVLLQHLSGVLRQRVQVLEVRLCHLVALLAQFVHGRAQVTVGAAEAHDEQVGIIDIAVNGEVGHLDVRYLLRAQTCHQVVVLGVGGYRSGVGVFLQTAQDVLEALAAWHCPVACAVLGTHVWCPLTLQFLRNIRWVDGVEFRHVGQFECSRAVGCKGIGEQHHGSHVLQCYLACLISSVKAVGRTGGCHHRHRALAVAAEQYLQEVGLLRLGGKTCCRSAALHVEHHERQLHDDCKVHCLALEADAGTRGARNA